VNPTVEIQVLPEGEGLPLPAYETAGAAGLDLRAAIGEPVTLQPGERALITAGIRLGLPPGYEGQVRPRSGLAWRNGLTLLNSPGTIDADYRGDVQVILINHGTEPFTIQRGDRIAQLIIAPVVQAELQVVGELSPTKRGENGFGSTGRQ
jgi:dUTP pyrophosphatase